MGTIIFDIVTLTLEFDPFFWSHSSSSGQTTSSIWHHRWEIMNDNCVVFDNVVKKTWIYIWYLTLSDFSAGGDGNLARSEFLNYALSLMRFHNDKHADSLPSLDISSMRHVVYVFDALIYYMRSGINTDADVFKWVCVSQMFITLHLNVNHSIVLFNVNSLCSS